MVTTVQQETAAAHSGLLERMRLGETKGIAEFRAIVADNPGDAFAMGTLAWALALEGDHAGAIELYEQIASVQPENVEVRWRIADRLVNLGNLDAAEAAYRDVLVQHPSLPEALIGVRYVEHLRRQRAKCGDIEHDIAAPVRRPFSAVQQANAELNRKEYEAGALTLRSLPTNLYLESTTKCNFFCKTCSKGYEAYHAEDLQLSIREKVRAEVMPTNTLISITGFGEPTLSSDFDDILEMSIENGSFVHFVTNASLLSFERLEKLIRSPVTITISFDGATKQTFEDVRAGSNFERTLDKLAMIRKLRDIHLSGSLSLWYFNFVALRCNIAELPDVVRIAHRYGIDAVNVADYSFNNNEFDDQSLRYVPAEANRCMREARAVAAELGVKLSTPGEYDEAAAHVPVRKRGLVERIRSAGGVFPAAGRFPRRCSSPWKEPYINTSGVVTPCCASGEVLGDLKSQSFQRIWNGWRYKLLRLRIHSAYPSPGCRRCFVHWGINGGNAGNAMAKEGLIIKGLYWLEHLLLRQLNRLGEARRRMARTLQPSACSAEATPPAPNYQRGRPIRQKATTDEG